MGDKEEGEVSEEGELPEEGEENTTEAPAEEAPAAAAPAQPPAPAPTAAEQPVQTEVQQAPRQPVSGPPAQQSDGQRREQQQKQHPAAVGPPEAAARERERAARERRGSAEQDGRPRDHHDRHRSSDREKAELSQELDRLTADLTFQEIRMNWSTACPNIKAAIKKLDKLLRRVKKKREDDVELYPPCYEFAGRILAALRHVLVITSTGLGKTVDMEAGHALMRSALNYRHDIFSGGQKRELEAAIRDSKEFQYLFTDRDKGRSSSKHHGSGSSSRPTAGQQQDEQQQQQQERQQQKRVPLARGGRTQRQQEQAAGGSSRARSRTPPGQEPAAAAAAAAAGAAVEKGGTAGSSSPPEAEAAATAAAAAPPAPPPPAAADSSPADASPAEQQQQQQHSPAAASAGKPAPTAVGGTAATRSGSIKIVVNSTAVGAAAAADAAATAAGSSGGWPQGSPGEPPAAAAGAGGSSASGLSGLKRGAVEIRDLDADEDDVMGDDGYGGYEGGGEGQQAAKRARLDEQQQQQQEGSAVPPWESEEHQLAVENSTPLQAVMSRLLEGRRLVLVLDLDHTLVNSVKFNEVDPEWEFKLEQNVAEQLSRRPEEQDLHRLVRMGMWTKLRPGVRQFLAAASRLFELWIYTAGSRAYADAMAKLLDPQGVYFGGRIIAQGVPGGADDAPPPAAAAAEPLVFKRLLQGLEGCEPLVLIVDDSSAVWPHDRRNLFVVERYIYFPSSRKRLGMAGRSLLEVDRDECPVRGMLMTALRVFEALHAAVFERLPRAPLTLDPGAAAVWDVRNVMAAEKRRVLEGVVLVFSRVIPLETNPRQHPLWLLAEQYGASCSEACSESTTHVVAMTGGTEKVMWARQNNKFVVGPAWLECSCIVWQRAAEERFPPPQ